MGVSISSADRPKAVVLFYEKKIKISDINVKYDTVTFYFSFERVDAALKLLADADIKIIKQKKHG